MKKLNNSVKLITSLTLFLLLIVQGAKAMPLRSLVALPLDKNGFVVRFYYEQLTTGDRENLVSSVAYGLSTKQVLLIAMPYQIKPKQGDGFADLSVLVRHTVFQDDFFLGTSRFALLAGVIVANDNKRDQAMQAGFVYSFFKKRHEFDIDALYQAGIDNRLDSGRYDISWQYRLSPSFYPDWGIAAELNSVFELNGRWTEGQKISQQVTVGLQWIKPTWVIEAGLIKGINKDKRLSLLISTRYHF